VRASSKISQVDEALEEVPELIFTFYYIYVEKQKEI